MKITRKTNFRVIVEPRAIGDLGWVRTGDHLFGNAARLERMYQERCEEIRSDIKRHVDNAGWIGVECDTQELCSYCERQWEVEETDEWPETPKGCPVCCQKAIDEWHSENLKTQATEA